MCYSFEMVNSSIFKTATQLIKTYLDINMYVYIDIIIIKEKTVFLNKRFLNY